MKRLSTLAAVSIVSILALRAQTSDIIVFSEMGEKFTLVIDGEVKNEAPATRVEAKGVRNETPLIVVRIAETGVPPVRQNAFMEFGKVYTLRLTTNKKGEYVLRMQGMTDGASTSEVPAQEKPKPASFQEDVPATQANTVQQNTAVGGQSTTTTVHTTETTDGTGENVNVNFGINGMGVNFSVTDPTIQGSSTTTTTTTHTTTTTTGGGTTVHDEPPARIEEPVYRMPGYSGPIGCPMPMSSGEFNDAKASISAKSFEDSKMTLAKQIGGNQCFSVDQVKGIMGLFSFEDSKLDFAKFAYDHTHDKGNYYKVNDAFTFETSIEALDEYIKGR